MLLVGLVGDGLELFRGDFAAEMDVADEEKFELGFGFFVVEAIARVIKTVHDYFYFSMERSAAPV